MSTREQLLARLGEIDPEDANVHLQEQRAGYERELAALDTKKDSKPKPVKKSRKKAVKRAVTKPAHPVTK